MESEEGDGDGRSILEAEPGPFPPGCLDEDRLMAWLSGEG